MNIVIPETASLQEYRTAHDALSDYENERNLSSWDAGKWRHNRHIWQAALASGPVLTMAFVASGPGVYGWAGHGEIKGGRSAVNCTGRTAGAELLLGSVTGELFDMKGYKSAEAEMILLGFMAEYADRPPEGTSEHWLFSRQNATITELGLRYVALHYGATVLEMDEDGYLYLSEATYTKIELRMAAEESEEIRRNRSSSDENGR